MHLNLLSLLFMGSGHSLIPVSTSIQSLFSTCSLLSSYSALILLLCITLRWKCGRFMRKTTLSLLFMIFMIRLYFTRLWSTYASTSFVSFISTILQVHLYKLSEFSGSTALQSFLWNLTSKISYGLLSDYSLVLLLLLGFGLLCMISYLHSRSFLLRLWSFYTLEQTNFTKSPKFSIFIARTRKCEHKCHFKPYSIRAISKNLKKTTTLSQWMCN